MQDLPKKIFIAVYESAVRTMNSRKEREEKKAAPVIPKQP
jgi:hypothetical protein